MTYETTFSKPEQQGISLREGSWCAFGHDYLAKPNSARGGTV